MGKTPTEYLAIRDCQTVRSADDEVGKPHAFRVDGAERTFFLVAETKEAKERWIGAIGKAMLRGSVMLENDL
jgi:hypothetical protein